MGKGPPLVCLLYDYALTLDQEMRLVWKARWNVVTLPSLLLHQGLVRPYASPFQTRYISLVIFICYFGMCKSAIPMERKTPLTEVSS